MDRSIIEQLAADYLDLPFRIPSFERILVDVLVALEVFAFGKEMYTRVPAYLRWLPVMSPLQQKHVLRSYVGGRVLDCLVLLWPAYLADKYLPHWIGTTPAAWVAGVLFALFCLSFGLSTLWLPFGWWNQRKARGNVREMMKGMIDAYAELGSGGPVSTRRVLEVVTKAADKGVVWPGPLFAVLDDNSMIGSALANDPATYALVSIRERRHQYLRLVELARTPLPTVPRNRDPNCPGACLPGRRKLDWLCESGRGPATSGRAQFLQQ